MSDENIAEPEEAPATEEVKTETPQTVPVHVVEELRAKARKAEEELETLRAAEEERAKAELSEVERLKLELDEQKAAAEKAQTTAMLEAKRSKARVALAEARAFNTEKALRLLDLKSIDEANIAEAVNELTESDPYLFRGEDEAAPSNVGAPSSTSETDGDTNGPDQDLIWLKQAGLI